MVRNCDSNQDCQNPLNLTKEDVLKEIEILRSNYLKELSDLRCKYGPPIAKRIAYIEKYFC